MEVDPDGVDAGQKATLEFADPASVATSLLLTSARIQERQIDVKRPSGVKVPTKEDEAEQQVASPTPTALGVISGVLAAGYVVGDSAVTSAKDFDEKNCPQTLL